MDFSDDFVQIQGILNNIRKEIGDFTDIRNRGGNENKLAKIIGALTTWLNSNRYLRKGKINSKYETKLRELHLFLVLNTDFSNKSMFVNHNKYSHLVNTVPQLSKCVLANIVWHLDLIRFYSEAIFSLPIEISLELIEQCNNCIKKSEPFSVLEQVAMVVLAIYVKIYHVRNEPVENTALQGYITRLLERFTEVLQNYITPETSRMSTWPQKEMYQYLGVAILKIFNLLKCCFNIFVNNDVNPVQDIYKVYAEAAPYCPERLDRSGQALKRCNVGLVSVCEANLEAITVDIFCVWTEFQHNNAQLQKTIGVLAWEVRRLLDNFEGNGKLPQMLDAIATAPFTTEEQIYRADVDTVLAHVCVKGDRQRFWIKALLRHGILSSDRCFESFRSIAALCDKRDWALVLNSCAQSVQSNLELRDLILRDIQSLPESDLVEALVDYFQENGFGSSFQDDTLDVQINELFNKLHSDERLSLPVKSVLVLVLQNPTRLIQRLVLEGLKDPNHSVSMVHILRRLEPICKLKMQNGSDILFDTVLSFVERPPEQCALQSLVQFVQKLLANDLLPKYTFEKLVDILTSRVDGHLGEATVIMQICQVLPEKMYVEGGENIALQVLDVCSRMRWNFFSYSEDRVQFVTEAVNFLRVYAKYVNRDRLRAAACAPLDKFHLQHGEAEFDQFLGCVCKGYVREASRNEKVCRLLKLLQSCVPCEWELATRQLVSETGALGALDLLSDVLLVFMEISKKSGTDHGGLGYCFRQFCVVTKTFILPRVQTREEERTFMKVILKLVKNLPSALQDTNDLLLVSLFDLERMKHLSDDQEFVRLLMSISHLGICKIISGKLLS